MIKHQLIIGFALLVGVTIGYFAAPTDAPKPTAEADGYVPKAAIDNQGESASLAALRRRVAELEELLARKDQVTAESISNAVAQVRAEKDTPSRPNPREWMENLKKNDPARFVQMTNRFAQFRRNRAARAQAKAEFLASVNTSSWSSSAKKTHDEVQELLARREELEEEMHQTDLTDDQRRKIMDEMRATDRALRSANKTERSNLISEVAQAVGLEGDAATELAQTIQDVYEATDSGRNGPPGPPPGETGNAAGGPPPM